MEAVAAYRKALEECTRERELLNWSRTQNNFGIALRAPGESRSGTEQLERAVAAFDSRFAVVEEQRSAGPIESVQQGALGSGRGTSADHWVTGKEISRFV